MVTGCGRVLHQHRPLAIASVIHEVSVPSPGWGRRATQELDALSSCLSSWRGFTQQIVCLVLKATHSRTLILLGLAYWTGTGSGELPLGVFCVGGCGISTCAVLMWGFRSGMWGRCGSDILALG